MPRRSFFTTPLSLLEDIPRMVINLSVRLDEANDTLLVERIEFVDAPPGRQREPTPTRLIYSSRSSGVTRSRLGDRSTHAGHLQRKATIELGLTLTTARREESDREDCRKVPQQRIV